MPRGHRPDGHTRLRWQAEHAGALWHGDVCHGPALRVGDTTKPLRIHALLDDASRFVVALEAHHSEREDDMLSIFLAALRRHGPPDAGDVVVPRRRQRMKLHGAVGGDGEDAVREYGVGVAVEVEQRPEAPHEGDVTRVRVGDAVGTCSSPLPGEQLGEEHTECLAQQFAVRPDT